MIEVIEGTSFAKTARDRSGDEAHVAEAEDRYDRALADPQAFGVGLSEYIALGDWRLFFYSRDRLAKVTAKDVDDAATRYFVRDNRVVGFFIPEDSPQRAEIPAAPTASALLADYKPSAKGRSPRPSIRRRKISTSARAC